MSKSYRELKVWQKSYDLAKDVYSLCLELPKNELFGLTSQMQRAAVSIPSNIAEGQQRGSVKEFRQFLQIARGSAAELATQLQLSGDIYKLEVKNLVSDVEEVQKMLYGLIQKL